MYILLSYKSTPTYNLTQPMDEAGKIMKEGYLAAEAEGTTKKAEWDHEVNQVKETSTPLVSRGFLLITE